MHLPSPHKLMELKSADGSSVCAKGHIGCLLEGGPQVRLMDPLHDMYSYVVAGVPLRKPLRQSEQVQ